MPGSHTRGLMNLEEEHKAPLDEPVLEFGLLKWSDEEDTSSTSSSNSFSLCSSWSSSVFFSSSSYSSRSCSSLSSSSLPDLENTEEEIAGEPIVPPDIPSPVLSPSCVEGAAGMQAQGESSSHAEEGPGSVQGAAVAEPCGLEVLDEKMAEMVGFLLLKYITREFLREAEILSVVCPDEPGLLPVLFPRARECLQLIFGIELVEVDPQHHTYVLIADVGFRHAEAVCPNPGLLQNCVLFFILGVIIREGDCATKEALWDALSMIGLQAGEQHAIFGDPGELLSQVWVQEQYLECRQVLGSDPPCSVFRWGPRAHAAMCQVRLMEIWLSGRSRVQDPFHLQPEIEQEEEPELGSQSGDRAGQD